MGGGEGGAGGGVGGGGGEKEVVGKGEGAYIIWILPFCKTEDFAMWLMALNVKW